MMVSFLLVVVSEIGDKTFLMAAVLAMTNPRITVFTAAMSALVIMTILSCIMGQVLPQLISRQYTQLVASFLFLVFGFKLAYDTRKMTDNECMEELEEVTIELLDTDSRKLEEGKVPVRHWYEQLLSPVWIQAFTMTFLGEWGDRSQIASIID